ncbi:carbon-nitrogen hydrolase family protein [Clostridium sporogenes]|uniref:carbon-nitrogen hydrolase family protein n=1 Tax=Clostridium sporogenes TaxID=1509 RepID=UPI0006B2953E|nr:carbon-nitrogen hydrolase family protein [Clostridium sporogenes]KOY65414.1 hypothetical protein AN649_13115 [Clostridium sporogenes]MDS1006656.1 carbon-nitrogen hydrolase family protein [Clostridium sporogenes]
MQLTTLIICMDVIQGDLKKNLCTIKNKISEGAKNGIDLIVFPQYSITGYPTEAILEEINLYGESIQQEICNYAKQYNVNIIYDMLEPKDEGFINRAIYVNNKGHMIEHYDRIHKFWREDLCYTGNSFKIIEINGIKVGLMMGDDLYYPQLSYALRCNEVHAIICLFYGTNHRLGNAFEFKNIVNHLITSHAVTNEIDFIFCSANGLIRSDDNQCIIAGGELIGKSMAFSISEGKILESDTKEDNIITTIDTNKIDFYRMLSRRTQENKENLYRHKKEV